MTKMVGVAKQGSLNKELRRANSREKGLSMRGKSAKVEKQVEKALCQLPLAKSSEAAKEPKEQCSFKLHQV